MAKRKHVKEHRATASGFVAVIDAISSGKNPRTR
jgi:hypothetical protein